MPEVNQTIGGKKKTNKQTTGQLYNLGNGKDYSNKEKICKFKRKT